MAGLRMPSTVAAVTYPEKKYLEILNLGTTSIPASNVWVNGTFMTHIDGIAYVYSAFFTAGPELTYNFGQGSGTFGGRGFGGFGGGFGGFGGFGGGRSGGGGGGGSW